ncbi:MAG: helix-turn-helix transcriptional regulator [Thiotrichaceae bacterium]|nr:helix-turn-helix transcriptional regulator [Thiotrichaceae bacterium]
MQTHEKLKVMRLCKNWSQEDMAEKLGYSINGYAKIERGETDIKIEKLSKIAEVLGVDVQQLLDLNEKNIFNIIENIENFSSSQYGNVFLTETKCIHELEKTRLLLQERDKEITYLKEMIELLKKDKS